MARTISSTIETALSAHMPVPGYLLRVGIRPELRYSTIGDVTWDGVTWFGNAMRIGSIGEDTATVLLRNDDLSGSSLVLNNKLLEVRFDLYVYYDGDAEKIFTGYGGAASVGAMDVSIEIETDRMPCAAAVYQLTQGRLPDHLGRRDTHGGILMAAFPTTNLSRTSKVTADAGIRTEKADDGTVKFRRVRTSTLYNVSLVYDWLDQNELDTLRSWVVTNGYGPHTFTLRTVDYLGTMTNDPMVTEQQGVYYRVVCNFIAEEDTP